MERIVKSEAAAKLRVEEIEEALRENTLALENARAEVEGLSSELTVSRRQHQSIIPSSLPDHLNRLLKARLR